MLDEILQHKRRQLQDLDLEAQIEKMIPAVAKLAPVRSLKDSLSNGSGVSIVAEIKRRSPSKGVLAKGLDAEAMAQTYQRAGARAISVVTESRFFGGSTDDLKTARDCTNLPVLRKDFILHEFQVWESRLIGADAVLLIASLLEPEELYNLHALAREIGLEVLLEIHTKQELKKALQLNPEIVGINNRNLETFVVDLQTAERLAPLVPRDTVCISESGIRDRQDILHLQQSGVDAVLVGEEIVTSRDPYRRIRQLLGEME